MAYYGTGTPPISTPSISQSFDMLHHSYIFHIGLLIYNKNIYLNFCSKIHIIRKVPLLSELSPLVTLLLNHIVESQIFVSIEHIKLVSMHLINIHWLDAMACKGKLRSTGDSGYESCLQDAIKGLQDGACLTISEAARKSRVHCRLCDARNTTYYSFQVAWQTLQNWFKGQTVSMHKAAEKAQLLVLEEEGVLSEWCSLHGFYGKPVSAPALCGHALAISRKPPEKNWHCHFISHNPSLIFGKSSGLDPKHAKSFNKTVVLDYFEKRKNLNDRYNGIPSKQDWNMDKKGIQMGRGRKNSGRKYIFVCNRKEHYPNLKLVMVIECISAAGEACPPSFILSDGPMSDVRDLPDGSVGKCVVSFHPS